MRCEHSQCACRTTGCPPPRSGERRGMARHVEGAARPASRSCRRETCRRAAPGGSTTRRGDGHGEHGPCALSRRARALLVARTHLRLAVARRGQGSSHRSSSPLGGLIGVPFGGGQLCQTTLDARCPPGAFAARRIAPGGLPPCSGRGNNYPRGASWSRQAWTAVRLGCSIFLLCRRPVRS
jgi:hypothetical protein